MELLGFFCAAVLLTIMPGPDIIFVITQSITRGKRAGIIFAAGLCSGLIVHTTAVCLGVSVILTSSPVAFTILKLVGASYLLYLGVKAFSQRYQKKINLGTTGSLTGKLYRKGVLMNVLNPKVILFFLAFFPQFVGPDLSNPVSRMLLLGVIFMFQAFVIFSLVAVMAGRLSRTLMQYPRFQMIMSIVESVVYLIIAVSIILI